MKIGILTFHNVLNYGAVLQCYALQSVIRDLGHDTSVIDFNPKAIVAPYRLFAPISRCKTLLSKTKYLVYLSLISRSYYKRKNEFKCFLKKYMRLSSSKESYDYIIYGSDQIWNPLITHNIPEYWGKGKLSSIGKISYSASAGNLKNLDSLSQKEITEYLKNFENISVREENLRNYLQKFTKNNIYITCDPVILNPKEDWIRLCIENECKSNILTKDKYIFVYNLTCEKIIEDLAEQVRQATGYKIIEFRGGVCIDDRKYPERESSKSPIDFVNAIRNAAFVVTSSFHGLAFSLIFGKKFIVHSIHNTDRIKHLVKLTNLEYRFSNTFYPDLLNEVDSKNIDDVFTAIRSESMAYLRDALKFRQK